MCCVDGEWHDWQDWGKSAPQYENLKGFERKDKKKDQKRHIFVSKSKKTSKSSRVSLCQCSGAQHHAALGHGWGCVWTRPRTICFVTLCSVGFLKLKESSSKREFQERSEFSFWSCCDILSFSPFRSFLSIFHPFPVFSQSTVHAEVLKSDTEVLVILASAKLFLQIESRGTSTFDILWPSKFKHPLTRCATSLATMLIYAVHARTQIQAQARGTSRASPSNQCHGVRNPFAIMDDDPTEEDQTISIHEQLMLSSWH